MMSDKQYRVARKGVVEQLKLAQKLHRKQVWRSLGKLRAESYCTTAQKVFMNEHDTEVSTENADFIDGLKVTPYDGELPKISKNVGSMSYYQYCLMQKLV